MTIKIRIIDGPLNDNANTPLIHGAGAVVCFCGIVREMEDGRRLKALNYEVYSPMAERELHRLAQEMAETHGLVSIEVDHSRGCVRVGECSFRLRVASMHRKASLAAMDEFIDRMKRDIPIWKHPIFLEDD